MILTFYHAYKDMKSHLKNNLDKQIPHLNPHFHLRNASIAKTPLASYLKKGQFLNAIER